MKGLIAKYISVKRSKDGVVKSITEAHWGIDIEPNFNDDDIDYDIEIMTYPMNSKGQFAISFGNLDLDNPPYLMNEEGSTFELIAIKTNDSKEWWVEKNISKKDKSIMKSNLRNHIGVSKLVIPSAGKDVIIQIDLNDNTLDEDGTKLILDAFKGEFYKLIYNQKGITSVGSISDIDVDPLQLINFKLVREFIESLDTLTTRLYKSLNKSKKLESSERIKNDIDFLKKYIANPYKKYYESTYYLESVDNSVNGFLLYMAIEVRLLLLSIINNVIKPNLSNLEIQINFNYEEYINNNKPDNEQIIQNQIVSINLNNKRKQEKLDKLVDGFYTNEGNCNFDKVLYIYKWRKNSSYAIYNNDLSYRLPIRIHNSLEKNSRYRIIGFCRQSIKFPNYNIMELSSVKKIESDINTNFHQSISHTSKYDINYCKETNDTINKLKEKNRKDIENFKASHSIYLELVEKLSTSINFLENLNIKSNGIKPISLVYSNNEYYSNTLSLYYKIFDKKTVDSINYHKLFNNPLLPFELPKIYERWVLIIILNILIYKFKFKPTNNNWSHIVVEAIYGKKEVKNLAIKLVHSNGSCIDFIYEKELVVDGREHPVRPDYVLYFNQNPSDNTSDNHTLVLDAKFYSSIDLLETVNNLKDNKDYKQGNNNNWVYIITSVSNLISHPISNRIWSKQAYYGEAYLPEDDNSRLPNHCYGGIFLHPDIINNPFNMDNLQRLLGMFLQTHGHNYCIACGSPHNGKPKKNEVTNGTKYFCSNKKNCGFQWVKNHCRSCDKIFYKNGFYWTYHMLSLNEPTKFDNIVCPQCGDYFTNIRA